MSPLTLEQGQLETLSQFLTAGGHQDVPQMLQASLERLITFWPAQAGTMLYTSPHGEMVHVEHGTIQHEARTLIEQARTSFRPGGRGGEPAIGYYSLEEGQVLLELPLRSGSNSVGLLHLVVEESLEKHAGNTVDIKPEEDLLILLVRAIGGEADKLAMLQRAERDLRELRLLYEVGQSLSVNLDLTSLLNDIKAHAPEVVGAERCSIFILDEQNNEMVLDLPGENREFRIPADRGIAGWVALHGIPQVVNDVEQDARWYDGIGREVDFVTRSLLCVPMRVKDRVIGVMQLLNKRGSAEFTDQDVQLLTTLASQAGIAIENARLYRSLKQERDRLLSKEEEVRHAIARDLHDGPAQSLSAISMNIEFIKKLLQAMPDRVPSELDILAELVRKTTHDIRTLLFELRPLGLETQGLLATLQQYVARWRDPSGGGTQLRLEAPMHIPAITHEAAAATFIIIQEAVNNARKHAKAPTITIYLYEEEGHLIASVRDRGKGFHLEAVESNYNTRGSLGLINMRERAGLIGAELRMRSAPGEGTTVELRIPLSEH
jgi:signal transduction histidine kinase